MTLKAGPNMIRVRKFGDDEAALRRAYDGFRFWSSIRGAFHIAAFFCSIVTILSVRRGARSAH